ncbi:MAG: hypothetical protein IPM53_13995 [Anaerolineaceae bacterium]|nr:hypothetical protein [Anaerolineaceae bacterium]
MSEAAGSSITDLLINQPILVWSLAGGLAILVIAGFLGLFLSLRGRSANGRTAKEASPEEHKDEARGKKTAVANTKTKGRQKGAPTQPPEAGQAPVATNAPIANDQAGFLLIEENTEALEIELDELIELDEEAVTAEPDKENALAALFTADSIVDPHVKALRDHLPVITIDELLTNVRSVSHELQKQINASHTTKH